MSGLKENLESIFEQIFFLCNDVIIVLSLSAKSYLSFTQFVGTWLWTAVGAGWFDRIWACWRVLRH